MTVDFGSERAEREASAMRAPLVPVALAFAAGAWLGLTVPPPVWLPPAAVALGALALLATWRRDTGAASVAMLALVLLAGWGRCGLPDPLPPHRGLRAGPARLEGIVSGELGRDGPMMRVPLLIRATEREGIWRPATGSLTLHLYGRAPAVRPGDAVQVSVTLGEPGPLRNPPDVETVSPRWRAPARWLAVGRAETLAVVPGNPLPWWLRVRLWVHEVVRRELPPVSGALLEGLLIGERRQLPPTLLTEFRTAGVFHVLAISGFNVALVVGAVFFVLRVARVPPRPAAALTLGALGAFVVVVGAQASVLRAAVMGSLVLLAQLLGREAGVWNGVAAALGGLLALDPGSLVDPGFQLSFAATAGILHLGPALRARLGRWLPGVLATALAVSLGAQLAVTPILVARWGELSVVGVVANLAVVPLAALLTMLGGVAILLAAIWASLAHLVFQSLWMVLVALRAAVRAFAALPFAVLYVPQPPGWALAAASAALGLAPLCAGHGARIAVATLVVAAAAGTGWAYRPDGRLTLTALDVGQGEAILVRGPDGRALLVDTGGGGPGRVDRGERVVLPVLRRTGVRRLDALALTHGDPDHAGGLASLLRSIPVGEVWLPAGAEAGLGPALAEAGVRHRTLARGDHIWLGPVLVTVLHPAPAEPDPARPPALDTNNRSLVLRVEWGLAATVLTGDAERPAEEAMLAAGVPLGARILKVGHHGSRHGSSAAFLRAVGPAFALVSVGARNSFGHPHPSALARLDAVGAAVLRTDLDGAVEVASDGERLTVRRFTRPEAEEEWLLRGAP